MKKILITYLIIAFIPLTIFSQEQTGKSDSTKKEFKRYNYGIDFSIIKLPDIGELSKKNTKPAYGINGIINYNFNKKISLTSGLGFYKIEDYYYEKEYNYYQHVSYKEKDNFYSFNIPLMIQYQKPFKNTKFEYFVKAGIRFDYIILKERHTTTIYHDTTYTSYNFPPTDTIIATYPYTISTDDVYNARPKDIIKGLFTHKSPYERMFSVPVSIGVYYPLCKIIKLKLDYLCVFKGTHPFVTDGATKFGCYHCINIGFLLN